MSTNGRPLRGLTGPRARRLGGLLGLGLTVLLCSGPAIGAGDALPPEDAANPPLLRGYISTTGLSQAVPSKQWFRVPPTGSYIRITAREDGQTGTQAQVFVVSPPGSQQPYGELPVTKVRTLAFGLAPAVVTLRLSQIRKKYVEPWTLVGTDPFSRGGDNELTGRVVVRVADVRIDGHELPLGSGCRTAVPASLTLHGDAQYSSGYGGELTGTLDVPRFTGCGRGNDRLLSSFVSGTGNPIRITQTAACLDASCPPPPAPPATYPLPESPRRQP